MTSGPGADLIILARRAMAAAAFECPLLEAEIYAFPSSSLIAFENEYAVVEFSYDGAERHFSCNLSLWQRSLNPLDPVYGTRCIIAQIPVAALDITVPRPLCHLTDANAAIPYWVRLLTDNAQDLISGDFRRLAAIQKRLGKTPEPTTPPSPTQQPGFFGAAFEQPTLLDLDED